MTRADFDAKFATCVSSTGASYRAARDAINAAGTEVNPWIEERLTSNDWRERLVAQALQFWRQSPEVAKAVAAIAAAGGSRMAIPAPTVTGVGGPTRAATTSWSFEEDGGPRLSELVHKESVDFMIGSVAALL
ncbi:MAG: hypothetical protein ACT4P6_13335, partial [Gemmatimonadaceae bacterium]